MKTNNVHSSSADSRHGRTRKLLRPAIQSAIVCGLAALGNIAALSSETTFVGQFTAAGEVSGVSANAKVAWVACRAKGLRAIDYRHPDAQGVLPQVDSWPRSGTSDLRDVHVSGDLACIADYSYGLHVLNIAGGTAVHVGSVQTGLSPTQSGQPIAVCVSGDYAYLAMNGANSTRGKKVIIFRVRDPNNPHYAPTPVGEIKADGEVYDVHVQGTRCYLVDKTQTLAQYDVSTPSLPRFLDKVSDIPAEYVFATDTHVFASTGAAVGANQGVHVFKAAGLEPCSHMDNRPAHALKVSGNLAYIARREYGFQVRDVTNPCQSTVVLNGNSPELGQVKAVDVSSPFLFQGSGQGLFVMQVVTEQRTCLVDYCAVLTVPGRAGERFEIQYSMEIQNPITWHTLLTIVIAADGSPYVHTDLDSRTSARRFYRAIPLD